MKPKGEGKSKKKNNKVSVMVVRKNGLELWQLTNTAAHLAAALGAREGKGLLKFESITTKDGRHIPMNIQHAIMVKECTGNDDLHALLQAAEAVDVRVTTFTQEMIETTNDNKVKASTAEKDMADIEFLGIQLFGEQAEVERLTSQFELLK